MGKIAILPNNRVCSSHYGVLQMLCFASSFVYTKNLSKMTKVVYCQNANFKILILTLAVGFKIEKSDKQKGEQSSPFLFIKF